MAAGYPPGPPPRTAMSHSITCAPGFDPPKREDRTTGLLRDHLSERPVRVAEVARAERLHAGVVLSVERCHRIAAPRRCRVRRRVEPQAQMIGLDRRRGRVGRGVSWEDNRRACGPRRDDERLPAES